jgi:hypothetical protein
MAILQPAVAKDVSTLQRDRAAPRGYASTRTLGQPCPGPHWLRRSPETCARPCCGAICQPTRRRDIIRLFTSPSHAAIPGASRSVAQQLDFCILARRTLLTPGALRLNTT